MISLLLFGLLSGILLTWVFELVLKTDKKLRERYYRQHEVLFGYHVHHSTYGLAVLLVAIILFLNHQESQSVFWAAVGMGIILEHTISDGRFVFIEKQA
jgi:hypothetical protein